MLSAEGMSTRAIAPIVGVKQPQIVKDLAASRQVIPTESPTPPDNVNTETGELTDDPGSITKITGNNSASTLTGMNGKQYQRPATRKYRTTGGLFYVLDGNTR